MTKWTDHVKGFAQEYKMSYGCAMSDPLCKSSYASHYPKKESEKTKKVQERKKERSEKSQMGAEDKPKPKPKGRKPKAKPEAVPEVKPKKPVEFIPMEEVFPTEIKSKNIFIKPQPKKLTKEEEAKFNEEYYSQKWKKAESKEPKTEKKTPKPRGRKALWNINGYGFEWDEPEKVQKALEEVYVREGYWYDDYRKMNDKLSQMWQDKILGDDDIANLKTMILQKMIDMKQAPKNAFTMFEGMIANERTGRKDKIEIPIRKKPVPKKTKEPLKEELETQRMGAEDFDAPKAKKKMPKPKPRVKDETAIKNMIEEARKAIQDAEPSAKEDPEGFRMFKAEMQKVITQGLKSLAKPYEPKPKKTYMLPDPEEGPTLMEFTIDALKKRKSKNYKTDIKFMKDTLKELPFSTDDKVRIWTTVWEHWQEMGHLPKDIFEYYQFIEKNYMKAEKKKSKEQKQAEYEKSYTGSKRPELLPRGAKKKMKEQKEKEDKEDAIRRKAMIEEEERLAKEREAPVEPTYEGREKELMATPAHVLEDMIMSYRLKPVPTKAGMVQSILKYEAQVEEAQPMPYREKLPLAKRNKLTREMKKAIAEKADENVNRKLLPIKSDREKELEETEIEELEDIINDEKIKVKGKTKKAYIKAILKHEKITEGAKISPEEMETLETQTIALSMKYKGEKGISARMKKIADLRNELKGTRDVVARAKLKGTIERLMDIVSAEKKALKQRIGGEGLMTMNINEDTNGLTHIYPLSRQKILAMSRE